MQAEAWRPLITDVGNRAIDGGTTPIVGAKPHRCLDILGVPLHVVTMCGAVETIARLISDQRSSYVCLCDVHSVMSAYDDSRHMVALRAANLVLPDGMPLAWVGRMRGERGMQRVCGPDLMHAVCQRSVREGWRHYFLGGREGTAELLGRTLAEKYPGLNIAGTDCPPFRPQTVDEIDTSIAKIKDAKPHIVWVGLGCPKQELWMQLHHTKLGGMALIGVGAAFEFNSGRSRRAPLWMRSRGLEWLHRLGSEPRRLWRRYLIQAPRFILALAMAKFLLRVRTTSRDGSCA
jgi:N-acetylglucosaminyldiphosphoundecaprenol N-acetyl-beta-D-mannosaminyltransferase